MKPIQILPNRISKDTVLSANKLYIVQGEVRVLKKIRLTIQDQTTLLLVNGVFPKSLTKRSTLIFEQGSQLKAKRLHIKAANTRFKPVKVADNGGVWFLGNFANAAKDGVNVKINRKNPLSSFTAQSISTCYLGRADEYYSPISGKLITTGDDIDGISLLGVGPTEWAVQTLISHYSADDGIDLTNSHIRLMRLEIKSPIEDGINLSSSHLEIHRSLNVDVRKTKDKDRDLVDLETDDGASFLELRRGCWVRLKGVFGDQVVLSSKEMPRPNTKDDNEKPYAFSGKLRHAALIYSIDED
jgi:hypothetical protein